jgi:hypothetical protein
MLHIYPSPAYQAGRIAALESRLARIDPILATNEPIAKRPRLDRDQKFDHGRASDPAIINFYGAGFKTGFYGPSSERTAASYYPTIVKLVRGYTASQYQELANGA